MNASVVAAGLIACLWLGVASAEDVKPDTGDNKEKISLAIGLAIGGDLKDKTEGDVDLDQVFKGIKEVFSDKQSMTPDEVRTTLQAWGAIIQKKQQEKMAKHSEEMAKRGEEAKVKGEAFLAENKKKDGVVATPSGLQYKVVAEGKGDSPKPTDTVVVKYTGTFIDGKVFDSTERQGGKPASFPVNRVIPGWTEGLQLMKPGAKYQFVIPSNLAYADRPPPGSDIPPNSVLCFEVELLNVNAGK